MGGAGAIGTALLAYIQKDPTIEAYVTTRQNIANEYNIKYLKGNAKEINFLNEILKQKYDVIVDFMLYSVEEFQERMEILLNSTSKYVFLSSARVYAPSNDYICEASPRLLDVSNDNDFLKHGEYSLTKAKQENLLLNSGYKNWIIVRPYKTYNVDRLQLGVFEKEEWIFRAMRGKKIILQKNIFEKMTSLTYADDVAKVINEIIKKSFLTRNIYQIASPKSISWSDILKIYTKIIEEKCNKHVEVTLFNDNTLIEKIFNNHYRIKYDGENNHYFSDESVQELFLNTFVWTDVENGIEKCLSTFISENIDKELPIDWGIEGYFDRLTGEREKLGNIATFSDKVKYIIFRYLSINLYYCIRNIRTKQFAFKAGKIFKGKK